MTMNRYSVARSNNHRLLKGVAAACIIAGMAGSLTACRHDTKNADANGNEACGVKTQRLKKGNFDEPFAAHGKLKASRYADLAFATALPIKAVYVNNGQTVAAGQRIAEQDLFRLHNAIDQAKKSVEQAKLNMKDVIISQGYDPDQLQTVPAAVRQLAEVKSGYSLAKSQLEAASHELLSGVLTAPFSGVVANLTIQPHAIAQAGIPVCRIIDTHEMEVEFRIMEADLAMIQVGGTVNVTPHADRGQCYQAHVMDINPMVDENGTVGVRARLKGDRRLFDGMNVEVNFTRHLEQVMMVPRKAIVVRNGKQVVFTHEKGIARQHKVSVRQEARGICVIETEDGLNEDSQLIVEGQETMVEGAPVTRK